jgi:ferredoxin
VKDSTKGYSKSIGTGDAEKAVHGYLYLSYILHYLYNMAAPLGLAEKAPTEEIPPQVEEAIGILTHRVASESGSTETSTYHGKVMPLSHAEDLIMVNEDVELRDLERVIPYRIARDIVIHHPQKIALFDCPCRLLQENPCEPVHVCMAVGDPIASFLVEHGLYNSEFVTAEDAVEVLRAEHRRGHVHGAYFKDIAGGRFFAICNCCSCCCIGIKSWSRFKIPIITAGGYVARINEECTACGDCAEICPFGAIAVEETAVVDEVACMGCGVCEGACEYGAVELVLEPSKGEPLDIKKLLKEKD